jgi:cytochrome c oxidase subunit I+III
MVIEGSMFVLALVAYFYLRLRVPEWPTRVPEPSLAPGVITTAILVLGCVPNYLTKAAAEQYQAGRARIGLIVCILFAAAAIVARAFEFPALNVSWQANAYGSVTWLVLGLHTSHLVTELLESLVLAAIVFSTEIDGPRFVDLSENSLY